jgi:crotonobetainyl-CoA:carnitine CoA-transferase CaiB-like acyl-CoA transferase
MSVTGTPETAPLRVGYPVCDTIGGLTGAFAVVAALLRRARTGEGAFIDVSMLESTLSALGWQVSNWLTAGVAPRPMGNDNMTAAPSGAFRCAGGLLNIAANEQRQFEALARALGRPELAADPRFADREDRKRHRAALTAEIEAALAAATPAEWEARLVAAGVPAGRVLSVPEALDEPQVTARRFAHVFEAAPGLDRPLTVVRGGFLVDGVAPRAPTPPPLLGADTEAVLADARARRA